MAALHDGASQKAGLPTTCSAYQYARLLSNAKRLRHHAAVWAHKAISPTSVFHIGCASRVIGEKPLEFGKGLRECQIAPSIDIHAGHGASRRFRSSTTVHAFPMDTH
jgi:hypothetical protein